MRFNDKTSGLSKLVLTGKINMLKYICNCSLPKEVQLLRKKLPYVKQFFDSRPITSGAASNMEKVAVEKLIMFESEHSEIYDMTVKLYPQYLFVKK